MKPIITSTELLVIFHQENLVILDARTGKTAKENYLENYMAKNLYRLQTPLISEYDTETWKSGKEVTYVELLPLDGIEQTPQKKEQTNNSTGVKFIYYKTNNPNLFWTKPE